MTNAPVGDNANKGENVLKFSFDKQQIHCPSRE
jgi:hypothetical protein